VNIATSLLLASSTMVGRKRSMEVTARSSSSSKDPSSDESPVEDIPIWTDDSSSSSDEEEFDSILDPSWVVDENEQEHRRRYEKKPIPSRLEASQLTKTRQRFESISSPSEAPRPAKKAKKGHVRRGSGLGLKLIQDFAACATAPPSSPPSSKKKKKKKSPKKSQEPALKKRKKKIGVSMRKKSGPTLAPFSSSFESIDRILSGKKKEEKAKSAVKKQKKRSQRTEDQCWMCGSALPARKASENVLPKRLCRECLRNREKIQKEKKRLRKQRLSIAVNLQLSQQLAAQQATPADGPSSARDKLRALMTRSADHHVVPTVSQRTPSTPVNKKRKISAPPNTPKKKV